MSKQEKISGFEKSEKQKRWDEIAESIGKAIDILENNVDEGIRESVVALNALGINTSASCEGHLDRAIAAPWIDIAAEKSDRLGKEIMIERERGIPWKDLKGISNEIKLGNLEEVKKLFPYLDEFYKDRDVAAMKRLIITRVTAGAPRLLSQGADFQERESDEEVRKQRLAEYREEMRAFTAFLREKYFQEE